MQNKLRLKRKKDFRKVYNYGRSVANRELVMFIMENKRVESYRFGISVSKKIGKAVTRNRVKRLIKEAINSFLREYELDNNIDIIIIARTPTANMELYQFEKSLKDIFRKAKLLRKK